MKLPSWYVSIPQPARWGVAGGSMLGVMGAVTGLVEAVALYPLGSWFGVTLYLAVLVGIPGFVLGLVGAVVLRRS
jgi:hypothetical protein